MIATYLQGVAGRARLEGNRGDDSCVLVTDETAARELQEAILALGRPDAPVREFLERLGTSRQIPVTFSDAVAYERKLIEFLSVRHSLVRLAVHCFTRRGNAGRPIHVTRMASHDGPVGVFFYFLYEVLIEGIRQHSRLLPVAIRAGSSKSTSP